MARDTYFATFANLESNQKKSQKMLVLSQLVLCLKHFRLLLKKRLTKKMGGGSTLCCVCFFKCLITLMHIALGRFLCVNISSRPSWFSFVFYWKGWRKRSAKKEKSTLGCVCFFKFVKIILYVRLGDFCALIFHPDLDNYKIATAHVLLSITIILSMLLHPQKRSNTRLFCNIQSTHLRLINPAF